MAPACSDDVKCSGHGFAMGGLVLDANADNDGDGLPLMASHCCGCHHDHMDDTCHDESQSACVLGCDRHDGHDPK